MTGRPGVCPAGNQGTKATKGAVIRVVGAKSWWGHSGGAVVVGARKVVWVEQGCGGLVTVNSEGRFAALPFECGAVLMDI